MLHTSSLLWDLPFTGCCNELQLSRPAAAKDMLVMLFGVFCASGTRFLQSASIIIHTTGYVACSRHALSHGRFTVADEQHPGLKPSLNTKHMSITASMPPWLVGLRTLWSSGTELIELGIVDNLVKESSQWKNSCLSYSGNKMRKKF